MDMFLFLLSSLVLNGVFGDEVKSVMEGHSVTLNTDIEIQRDDKIMWYYGLENTFVARITKKDESTMLSDDERYKDRLKLNDQTGSLTINNLTTDHSRLYTLKISSNNKVSYKTFNVTVYGSPVMKVIITTAVFALLICVTFLIIVIHKRKGLRGKLCANTLKHLNTADFSDQSDDEEIFSERLNPNSKTEDIEASGFLNGSCN